MFLGFGYDMFKKVLIHSWELYQQTVFNNKSDVWYTVCLNFRDVAVTVSYFASHFVFEMDLHLDCLDWDGQSTKF